MAQNVCVSRLDALRKAMEKNGIDVYMIPTADFHGSEYVADYFKVREYFSGFTGENATLVVTKDEADLWVDGRFFIQAEHELEGSGIIEQRMGEPGVPTLHEFLRKTMRDGETLGFDGRCVNEAQGREIARLLSGKHVKIRSDKDLAEEVWSDRPVLPSHPVFLLDAEKYAGETAASKLSRLRAVMDEKGAKFYVSSKLDEIMWLYNIRGFDVTCNPVALSYTFVTPDEAFLFIQDSEVTDELREYAKGIGLVICHYFAFDEFLRTRVVYDGPVLYDPAFTGYQTCQTIREAMTAAGADSSLFMIPVNSPVDYMKAVKNETEIRNFKEIYIEDSAAVTKFIYWLKKTVGREKMTEGSAAAHLDGIRAKIKDYVELSFPTISAYGENAAMMHYEPKGEGAEVKPEGMLLVDSGGQYMRGTTDVTRTMALGPVTDDMKKSYTLTAASMLQLMDTKFLAGSSGITLDIMAREPMWREGMDYKCGTGHGIGYLLNVHEGPQSIRYRKRDAADMTAFAPGMVVSDEPGVYKSGKYGIRIETILLCVHERTTEDGEFYGFEPLTYVPFDRDLIDPAYLSGELLALLNAYNAQVLEKIAPFLDGEEKAWLEEQCARI